MPFLWHRNPGPAQGDGTAAIFAGRGGSGSSSPGSSASGGGTGPFGRAPNASTSGGGSAQSTSSTSGSTTGDAFTPSDGSYSGGASGGSSGCPAAGPGDVFTLSVHSANNFPARKQVRLSSDRLYCLDRSGAAWLRCRVRVGRLRCAGLAGANSLPARKQVR